MFGDSTTVLVSCFLILRVVNLYRDEYFDEIYFVRKTYLEKNFNPKIRKLINKYTGSAYDIDFEVRPSCNFVCLIFCFFFIFVSSDL